MTLIKSVHSSKKLSTLSRKFRIFPNIASTLTVRDVVKGASVIPKPLMVFRMIKTNYL